MKKIVNPEKGKVTYRYSDVVEHYTVTKDIIGSDIDDNILGLYVELRVGDSLIIVDPIAEALKEKYPWVELSDYTPPKKRVKKASPRKSTPKKKHDKKKK